MLRKGSEALRHCCCNTGNKATTILHYIRCQRCCKNWVEEKLILFRISGSIVDGCAFTEAFVGTAAAGNDCGDIAVVMAVPRVDAVAVIMLQVRTAAVEAFLVALVNKSVSRLLVCDGCGGICDETHR
eukprot:scpid54376/ scgid32320/ 